MKNMGDSNITIKIESGIKLAPSYSDSLLELVDLYQTNGVDMQFSQSSISVYKMDGTTIDISAPISGMNQFRSFFSSNFYTYDERKEDLLRLKTNANQYTPSFINNANLPDEAAIKIKCVLDSVNGNHVPEFSVMEIKQMVQSSILVNNQKLVHIHFTTGVSSGIPTVGDGTGGTEMDGGTGNKGGDRDNGRDRVDVGTDEPSPTCNPKDVSTSMSFTAGLPNVFTWNPEDGYTYDFSISCSQGDCSTGLSYRKENVYDGVVEVEASWEQATEKKYTATLTVKCNGKVVKTVTKVVKLICA
jgi:hypothetical protein